MGPKVRLQAAPLYVSSTLGAGRRPWVGVGCLPQAAPDSSVRQTPQRYSRLAAGALHKRPDSCKGRRTRHIGRAALSDASARRARARKRAPPINRTTRTRRAPPRRRRRARAHAPRTHAVRALGWGPAVTSGRASTKKHGRLSSTPVRCSSRTSSHGLCVANREGPTRRAHTPTRVYAWGSLHQEPSDRIYTDSQPYLGDEELPRRQSTQRDTRATTGTAAYTRQCRPSWLRQGQRGGPQSATPTANPSGRTECSFVQADERAQEAVRPTVRQRCRFHLMAGGRASSRKRANTHACRHVAQQREAQGADAQ